MDFGEGLGVSNSAVANADEILRFGIAAPGGMGLGGRGIGPKLETIGDITFRPAQFDLDGGGVSSSDLDALKSAVVPLIERIVEPFDIDVQTVSSVTKDDSGRLDFSAARSLVNTSSNADIGDSYVLVSYEAPSAPVDKTVGRSAGDDLFRQDSADPNPQDELVVVFADELNVLWNDILVLGGIAPNVSFEEFMIPSLANAITHEAFHSFSFIHSGQGATPTDPLTVQDVIRPLAPFNVQSCECGNHNPDPAPSVVTRWANLPHQPYDPLDPNTPDNPVIETNNFEHAKDVFGLRDSDSDQIPDVAFVTGTGLHDQITLTANSPSTGLVTVEVMAYNNEQRTSLNSTQTYQIDLAGNILPDSNDATEGLILVEPSTGSDKVILVGGFTQANAQAHIKVRAAGMDDELEVSANVKAAEITFEGGRGNDEVTTLATDVDTIMDLDGGFGDDILEGGGR